MARRLGGLDGWRRYTLALALGAMLALAEAPFYWWPLLLPGFTALVWLLDGAGSRRRIFATCWCFAFGFFVASFYWTGYAFVVDAAKFAVLLPLPILGLPALLAFFPAVAITVLGWRPGSGPARILLLALGWNLADYARSYTATGFPWNLFGYVWGGSDAMMQSAAYMGVHGLGLLTIAAAAMPALLADGESRIAWRWNLGFVMLFAALFAGGLWRLQGAMVELVPDVRLRLVQPVISQRDKENPAMEAPNLQKQVDLSVSPGVERVTHFIWSETAVPFYPDLEPDGRDLLARLVHASGDPGNGLVITGAIRRTPIGEKPFRAWNSLEAVDGLAEIVASYDKQHLVPFGEYLPFRPILSRIGLDALAASGIDFSMGTSRAPVTMGSLPPARILVCYEDVFAEEIAPPIAFAPDAPRPAWLLNITNDGWFGDSSGPHQHFGMARFRSVEQGLPLVRAANTGASAIIDPYGRVMLALGLFEAGFVDGPLPRPIAPPPYARFGDLVVLPPFLLLCLLLALQMRRSRKEPNRAQE